MAEAARGTSQTVRLNVVLPYRTHFAVHTMDKLALGDTERACYQSGKSWRPEQTGASCIETEM